MACALVTLTSCAFFPPPRDDAGDPPPPAGTARLRAVDGGTDFYSRFSSSLPDDPNFFPIAVWSESVVDDTGWPVDKAAGINTYVQLTPDSDPELIDAGGMRSITSWAEPDAPTSGYFLGDEADMWAGPGSAPWTGNYPGEGDICVPKSAECGYTVMDAARAPVPPGRMTFANYGKGIAFWETDAQAARFVNDFQDVVSADVYWFTDPNVCGPSEGGALLNGGSPLDPDDCRSAANYGRTVQRVRSLVEPEGSKPVWNFVEVGHPFTESDSPTITVPQIEGAVWSSLINGARGIVYFVHNFGGDCQTAHAIRDCGADLRTGLASIDSRVTHLAPVLNAPFVDGLVRHDAGVDVAAKRYGDDLYLLAGSTRPDPQEASISFGCNASTADVVDENRTVPIENGAIRDSFADGNAVHVYRIADVAECLPS